MTQKQNDPSKTLGTAPDPASGDDLKSRAMEAVSAASERLKSGVSDIAEDVSERAVDYAEQAKESAADEVSSVASALRKAANELRSGAPQERSISLIAESLADVADRMRDKDLGEMVGDLHRFARKKPLLFLGGGALLGFAAARFTKASAHDQDDRPGGQSPNAQRPGGARSYQTQTSHSATSGLPRGSDQSRVSATTNDPSKGESP